MHRDHVDAVQQILAEQSVPDHFLQIAIGRRDNAHIGAACDRIANPFVFAVVDEAQNLDDSVLETLRLVSNFETENSKLIQIIIAGQPQLARKLASAGQDRQKRRAQASDT